MHCGAASRGIVDAGLWDLGFKAGLHHVVSSLALSVELRLKGADPLGLIA
jgi:hypothetical protein